MQTVRVEIPESLLNGPNKRTPTSLLEMQHPESYEYFLSEFEKERGRCERTVCGTIICLGLTIVFFPFGALCGLCCLTSIRNGGTHSAGIAACQKTNAQFYQGRPVYSWNRQKSTLNVNGPLQGSPNGIVYQQVLPQQNQGPQQVVILPNGQQAVVIQQQPQGVPVNTQASYVPQQQPTLVQATLVPATVVRPPAEPLPCSKSDDVEMSVLPPPPAYGSADDEVL